MSGVRTHFWQEVARRNGGVCWPRKYGLNGAIPALTSSSVGSSATRLAEGTTVWPCCSKKLRKRRTISADSMAAILHLDSGPDTPGAGKRTGQRPDVRCSLAPDLAEAVR